jgi:hypothetical protein
MTDNKRAADDAEREAIFRRIHNERGWMDLQDIFNAGWDEALSSRADGGKGEAALQRLTEEQERLGLYDDAPQAECAPREAQPNWKALHAAADAVAASADIWAGFSTQDAKVCVDAYLAAPTPERAQPVGPRTTLNYDGTFDTTCAHCGGNGCFACLKSAAPTPERADADTADHAALIAETLHWPDHWDTAAYPDVWSALQEVMHSFQCSECRLDPVDERADAGKDAALTEGELIAIGNALHGMGYDYLADKLRAILAANKEPK